MEVYLRPFSLNGERLKGCEVCWTCEYFNIQTYKCSVPQRDAESRAGMRLRQGENGFYRSQSIDGPESYNCLFWKDGET